MSGVDAFGGVANAIAWVRRWVGASRTDRPLPVPSTPLGLRQDR